MATKITRVRVTGGFLSGLDLEFCDGLNVIIGPRGSGKTVLLELMRHALVGDAPGLDRQQRSKYIKQILGSGEVIVDVLADGTAHTVMVGADGHGRSDSTSNCVISLGQNELESIAGDKHSRLALIDLRASSKLPRLEAREVAELTSRLFDLRAEIQVNQDQLHSRSQLLQDKAALDAQLLQLQPALDERSSVQRKHLQIYESKVLELERLGRYFRKERQDLERILQSEQHSRKILEERRARDELIETTGNSVEWAALFDAVDVAMRISSELLEKVTNDIDRNDHRLQESRRASQLIRAELDEFERGFADLSDKLVSVRAQLAAMEEKDAVLKELCLEIQGISSLRDQQLDAAEAKYEELFERRREAAREITYRLEDQIEVGVQHLADVDDFRNLVQSFLSRSKLQYRALAERISRTILPRQLLHIVESEDASAFSSALDIPHDRAVRAISALQDKDLLCPLSVLTLGDEVDFFLRQGTERKNVENLSTGQKCSVTLPIVLTESHRTIILDQPEDHLDNEFLVARVVKGLLERKVAGLQTIIATHNPNIPVLGEAPLVVAMRSDGHRGGVELRGPFDGPDMVRRITDLMEGGAQAFLDRAKFYGLMKSDVDG